MATKYDAPVCLSSSVTLARGGAAQLNFDKMTSRSRDWMRIRELRFFINPNAQTIASQYFQDSFGQLISVDAGIGRHRITNSAVPVWLLGPRLSWRGEFSEVGYLFVAGSVLPPVNCYTWTFPRPVLVGPGTSLGMLVSRPVISTLLDPLSQLPNAFTVEVAAVGERLAKPPEHRVTDVPYVTHFRTLPTTTSPYLSSGQGPLANPFRKQFDVERFNVRMASGATGGTTTQFNDRLFTNHNSNPDTRIRIYDGLNYEVTTETKPQPQNITGAGANGDNPQGKTIIDTVFSPQWGTWRVGTKLEQKRWYTAEFSQSVNFGDNQTTTEWAPMIAMVGSRKEAV